MLGFTGEGCGPGAGAIASRLGRNGLCIAAVTGKGRDLVIDEQPPGAAADPGSDRHKDDNERCDSGTRHGSSPFLAAQALTPRGDGHICTCLRP